MKKFDVLTQETQVLGMHFLEASAGTGKTFAIQHIVARLIVEKQIPLHQILIVTFTRAATRELNRRIRANLEMIVRILKTQGEEPSVHHFGYLQALFYQNRKQALRLAEEALLYFETAQIFTIHGFCHRMLSECAFEAHLGFGITDPDAKDYKTVLRQVIADTLRSDLGSSNMSVRQLDVLLKKHRYDIDQLVEKIANLLEKNTPFQSFPDFEAVFEEFRAQLERLPAIEENQLVSDYQLLAPCYKKMGADAFLLQVRKLGALLAKKSCSKEEFDALLKEKEWFLEGLREDNLKVRAKLPPRAALCYPGLFEQLRLALLPSLQEVSDTLKIFLRLAEACQRRWLAYFQAAELFSPDHLLKQMEESLKYQAFVHLVRQKFRAVFIDEFQDTDPGQWNIFRRLFIEEDTLKEETPVVDALYLVGDPKQSIYGFRSADVYTYLQAAEVLGSSARSFLDTNYRSHPELIDVLNRLFSAQAAPGWMALPKQGKILDVPPVKAGREDMNNIEDGKGSLHFLIVEEASKANQSWPSKEVELHTLFPFIAQEIRALTEQNVVVLIKDRFQGQRLAEYLHGQHIPCVIKRNASLIDSQAFACLEELMEAVNDPRDLNSLKRALGGLLIGWNAQELQQTEKIQQALFSFAALRDTLQARGFGVFFQTFLRTLYSGALEKDLLQLAETVMENTLFFPPEGYVSYLKELKAADRDALKTRPKESREESGVILMTTHMSKGLEFDVVFALGLASRHAGQSDMLVEKEENSASYQEAMHELDAEKMRQLYVALTRAKRRVYLPVLIDTEKRPVPLGQASPIELFCARLQEKHSLSPSELYATSAQLETKALINTLQQLDCERALTYSTGYVQTSHPVVEPDKELEGKTPVMESLDTGPAQFVRSFSTFAEHGKQLSFTSARTVRTKPTLPSSAETGTRIHRLLETTINQRLFAPFNEEKIRTLIRQEHFQEWEEDVYQMVHGAFHVPLIQGDQTFTLGVVPAAQMLQEMEFLFPCNGSFIKGFADLIFEWKGKYYLLDWKTNDLGESDSCYTQEKLEEAMKHHDYILQASIYASALERYVKLFDMRPFSESFGGAFYLFLRGKAVFHFFPLPLTLGDK